MWLEYIRYRFRLDKAHDLLELTQIAALKGLRNSPRCRGWRVLPSADDPTLLILEIEWDPGAGLTPFRGSEEFTAIHSALATGVRSLEEADYSVDSDLLRRLLGGPDALFRLTEDIVLGVMREPLLAWRFGSEDGSKRGRLGLWLLAVLGGPDLFSASFPGSDKRDGPLADDYLDLEERECLLEIALGALPPEEQYRCVAGNLRAHLPMHPKPHARLDQTPLLGSGTPEPPSEVRPSEPPGEEYLLGDDDVLREDDLREDTLREVGAPSERAVAQRTAPSSGEPRYQTGVRSKVEEETEAEQAAGHPWPPRPPTPTLRSRKSGRWPRWRARVR